MLSRLALRNFKTFRSEAEIPLAPITLIYGSNSSGKSTIIQALMLLKQTLDSSSSAATALLFGSEKYVDLGNYQNVIADHDMSQHLTFSIAADIRNTSLRRLPSLVRAVLAKHDLRFEVTSDLVGTPILSSISLYDRAEQEEVVRYARSTREVSFRDIYRRLPMRFRFARTNAALAAPSLLELESFQPDSELIATLYHDYERRLERIISSFSQIRRFQLEELPLFGDADAYEEQLDVPRGSNVERQRIDRLRAYSFEHYVEDLKEYNEDRMLVATRFLPYASLPPEGTKRRSFGIDLRLTEGMYFPPEFATYDFGLLLSTIGAALEAEFDQVSYIGPLRDFPERNYIFSGAAETTVGSSGENLPSLLYADERRVKELNAYADVMKLEYTIDVHKSLDTELDNVFSVRLLDKTTGVRVGLTDVGFGISQVLPILLQCAVSDSRIVVMEQPEIHLNPQLQASLGQVFAEASKNDERQFIIETHSEHLLLRLQKLIRRGDLDASKLCVLYVSKHREGSAVMPIPIGQNGDRLVSWPDGFFDDTYRELFDNLAN